VGRAGKKSFWKDSFEARRFMHIIPAPQVAETGELEYLGIKGKVTNTLVQKNWAGMLLKRKSMLLARMRP
jgi:hypothetical protein